MKEEKNNMSTLETSLPASMATKPTLIMNLAADSNMFIKLYVDDGCGYGELLAKY
jgi:hypothetical protein